MPFFLLIILFWLLLASAPETANLLRMVWVLLSLVVGLFGAALFVWFVVIVWHNYPAIRTFGLITMATITLASIAVKRLHAQKRRREDKEQHRLREQRRSLEEWWRDEAVEQRERVEEIRYQALREFRRDFRRAINIS